MGPYDQRLGYARLPQFLESASEAGFGIVDQARPSPALVDYTNAGYYPPYPEADVAGLSLIDERDRPLVVHRHPRWAFANFDAIPPIVWATLIWIEDRDLTLTAETSRNPALDWSRLARAFLELGLRVVDPDRNVPGGSTLATQVEKFRHSEEGRTTGIRAKFQQIVSASTRAYHQGPRTLDTRKRTVVSYLNSVPLAAQPTWGEVIGLGEGLQAWFGADPEAVRTTLWGLEEGGPTTRAQARAFAQVLSLIISQRRPTYYLRSAEGRKRLAESTLEHARILAQQGIVPRDIPALLPDPADTVGHHPLVERSRPMNPLPPQIQGRLGNLLGVASTYDLTRLDLQATVTLDSAAHAVAGELLTELTNPQSSLTTRLRSLGLLSGGDPGRVLYSVLLVESTGGLNRVRIDSDNAGSAGGLNSLGRLELGSTAKLRTLVTYLETVAQAHDRLAALPPDSLTALRVHERDTLTRWLRGQLMTSPAKERTTVLAEAMERRFSADPSQRFATGGGVQTFGNFDSSFDSSRPTVVEAFQHSVNLPFVRMLREVVDHSIFSPWSPTSEVLAGPDAVRRPYLERFVRREARTYLERFDRRYASAGDAGVLVTMAENRRARPRALTRALLWVDPDLSVDSLEAVLTDYGAQPLPASFDVAREHRLLSRSALEMRDVAYLSGIHPLELWIAQARLRSPTADAATIIDAGLEQALDVYAWLLDTDRRARQDPRIYAILEIEAFQSVLDGWRRLGYPYRNIVPSVGTAIGSSGDRPEALAELVGILINGGRRLPLARVTKLRFGKGTPYETGLERRVSTVVPVLDPAIADLVRAAMVRVVEAGTARRARGAFVDGDAQPLMMGAKTGTGDNRSRALSRDGAVRSRTATIVFFGGDRWFGVISAYVPGQEADRFRFTSALTSEVLRDLASRLDEAGVFQ